MSGISKRVHANPLNFENQRERFSTFSRLMSDNVLYWDVNLEDRSRFLKANWLFRVNKN